MEKMRFKYSWLPIILLGLTACDVNNELEAIPEEVSNEEVIPLNTNGLNLSNYISVGASFTAGFSDGTLFKASQENSFPKILANKFAMADGGAFEQPLMSDNIGGLLFLGNVIQGPRLYFDGSGPTVLKQKPTTEVTDALTGSFNNYGIPGAKSFHLVAPGYGNPQGVPVGAANPYFARFASSPTATVLGDALAKQPTFFTLSEVGGNDVLGYALAGGDGVNQEGNFNPATYGPRDITDPNVFANVFNQMVTALTANGAKGVVANVPYITSLAHFTTVPYNPVPLDAATAAAVNQAYAQYNGGIRQAFAALVGLGAVPQAVADAEIAKRTINFTAGQNAVVIVDEDLIDLGAINPAFAALPQYRQATEDDLFVLSSSSFIGTKADPNNPLSINGVAIPLADKWVLTPQEQAEIKKATDLFNTIIEGVANSNPNVVLIDFKSILQEASTSGLVFDDYTLTTNLVFGGLVSLDGVHLTSRGYALLANKILAVMDVPTDEGGFGTNFTEATDGLAKADNYPTNYSPMLLK